MHCRAAAELCFGLSTKLTCFRAVIQPHFARAVITELFNIYDPSRGYLRDYMDAMGKLLAEGKLVPGRVTVCNGLEGAKDGLQKLVDHSTSLEKLVVCV